MRRAKQGGLCSVCGRESDGGLFWENFVQVLDLGVPGVAPLEPDTTAGVRCDACEQRAAVREAFAADPAFARQVYGAETAEGALRRIGY